eukprot:sb/3461495/
MLRYLGTTPFLHILKPGPLTKGIRLSDLANAASPNNNGIRQRFSTLQPTVKSERRQKLWHMLQALVAVWRGVANEGIEAHSKQKLLEVFKNLKNIRESNGHQASLIEELQKQGLQTIKFNEAKYTHEQIGEGFWGEVFKIRSNGRVMVLKTSKQNESKITQNEINIMRSLDNPNIVKFLGVCITDNGNLYPLLEYINGGTLEDFLANDKFDISYISRFCIAENIASGMAYLHERNIMHRDLTSKNILLRVSAEHEKVMDVAEALITDFGLAKSMSVSNERALSQVGSVDWMAPEVILGESTSGDRDRVMDVAEALITDFGLAKSMSVSNERALSQVGSVDWMAPEVILGKEYDKKADVFSYGIILCEIIGRCVADPDSSVYRTINFEVNFEEFTKSSCEGCPADFLELAKKCCKLNPEDRPEFVAIKDCCSELISSYYEPSTSEIHDMDMTITRTSMDKLNLSESETFNSWDLQPRFNLNRETVVRALDDDIPSSAAVPIRRPSTASSIINPIPSVNRYSGAIVYTIRNDTSPHLVPYKCVLTPTPPFSPIETVSNPHSPLLSPIETVRPAIPEEILVQNRTDTEMALDQISRNSTIVYFNNMDTSEPASTSSNTSLATPFGKRQYSKRKKIRPGKLKKGPKSPRHDTKNSILNFLKNLGSSSSKESHKDAREKGDHQGKGKISKGELDQDTYSGLVTARGPPPLSPTPRRVRDFLDEMFCYTLDDFKGKYLALYHSASWCGPCRSPIETVRPAIPEEILVQNRTDTEMALDQISRNSTIVYFNNMDTSEPASTSSNTSLATPFGKRQYSKRKKIRPGKLKKGPKSPRHDTKNSILNFLKNLGSSSSKESHKDAREKGDHQGKGKISKGELDQDTYSGLVTARGPPPLSPTPRRVRDFLDEMFWSSPNSNQLEASTPTDKKLPPSPLAGREGGGGSSSHNTPQYRPNAQHISVARNDSYRMMKPFRAHSVPLDHSVDTSTTSKYKRASVLILHHTISHNHEGFYCSRSVRSRLYCRYPHDSALRSDRGIEIDHGFMACLVPPTLSERTVV